MVHAEFESGPEVASRRAHRTFVRLDADPHMVTAGMSFRSGFEEG
jgi:hypothetical protein